MSKKKARSVRLHLTERALADLTEIEIHSTEQWGKRVAAKYLADIESRLRLIQENPELLAPLEGLPTSLQVYPAGSHVLIFDVQPDSLLLLTVIHGSRDLPTRLAELAPMLAFEVEVLHNKLSANRKK